MKYFQFILVFCCYISAPHSISSAAAGLRNGDGERGAKAAANEAGNATSTVASQNVNELNQITEPLLNATVVAEQQRPPPLPPPPPAAPGPATATAVYCGSIEERPEMKVRGGHSAECFVRKPITFEVCRLLLIESPVCTALTYKNGMCRLHDRRRANVTDESASMRQQGKMITIYKYEEGFDHCLDDARFTYDTAENSFERCMIRLRPEGANASSSSSHYDSSSGHIGRVSDASADVPAPFPSSGSASRSTSNTLPFLGIVMAVNSSSSSSSSQSQQAEALERVYSSYRCYCAIHKCAFEVNAVHTDRHEQFLLERHSSMLRRFLWRYQWVMVVDPNSIILNMSFSLEDFLRSTQEHVIFQMKGDGFLDTDRYFVRNSPFSRCFLRMWARMKASVAVNAMSRSNILMSSSASNSPVTSRAPKAADPLQQFGGGARLSGISKGGRKASRAQFILNATLHRLQTANNGKGINLRRIDAGGGGGRVVRMGARHLVETDETLSHAELGTREEEDEEEGDVNSGGSNRATSLLGQEGERRRRDGGLFLRTVRWMPSPYNDAGDLMVAIMLLVHRQTVLACYALTQAKPPSDLTEAAIPTPLVVGSNNADGLNKNLSSSRRGIVTGTYSSSNENGAAAVGFMKCAKVFRDPLLNLNRLRGPASLIKVYHYREGLIRSIDGNYSDSSFPCMSTDVLGYSEHHSMSAVWQLHMDFVAMKAGSDHVCGTRRDGEQIEDFLLNSMCSWKYGKLSTRCRGNSCFSTSHDCYRTPLCVSTRASRARWVLCSQHRVCDPGLRREDVDRATRNETYREELVIGLNFTEHLFL